MQIECTAPELENIFSLASHYSDEIFYEFDLSYSLYNGSSCFGVITQQGHELCMGVGLVLADEWLNGPHIDDGTHIDQLIQAMFDVKTHQTRSSKILYWPKIKVVG